MLFTCKVRLAISHFVLVNWFYLLSLSLKTSFESKILSSENLGYVSSVGWFFRSIESGSVWSSFINQGFKLDFGSVRQDIILDGNNKKHIHLTHYAFVIVFFYLLKLHPVHNFSLDCTSILSCHAARISLSNTIKILRDFLTVKIPRNCYEYEHCIIFAIYL